MLVLSRRVGEAIRIGDDVVIYVTRKTGSRVVLGIDAPRSRRILRGELTSNASEEPVVFPDLDADNTSISC